MFSFLDTTLYGDSKESKPNGLPTPSTNTGANQHVYSAQNAQHHKTSDMPQQPPTVTQNETVVRDSQCHCGKELNTLAEVLQARIQQAERRTAMMEQRLLQVFENMKQDRPQSGCSWTALVIIVVCFLALLLWIYNVKPNAVEGPTYPVMIPGGASTSPIVVPLSNTAQVPTTFMR